MRPPDVTERPPAFTVRPAANVEVAFTVRVCRDPIPIVVFPFKVEAFETESLEVEAELVTPRLVEVASVAVSEAMVPRPVSEELMTPEPRVVAERTEVLLIL